MKLIYFLSLCYQKKRNLFRWFLLKFLKIFSCDFFSCYVRRIFSYLDSTAEKKQILLLGTPEHGNIGDLAIAFAEIEFLRKYFSEFCLAEIPSSYVFGISAKRILENKQRLFCVHGGGFLGNLWISEEKMFQNVLKIFEEKKIVVFPQSIFFEKTANWELDFQKTRTAYRSHPDLHIFIRDNSIDFLRKEIVEKNTYSVPDIVLSLDRSAPKFERKGVLLCFRADKEKVVPVETFAAIEENLRSRGESCSRTDMVVPYGVPAFAREIEVEKKFDEFRRSRLVITDRLHGMIFATITGTPCIAVNNISKKVQGVWELWIRERFPYVKFVENADEIPALLDEMLALGPQRYEPSVFDAYWQQLANVVRGGVKE